MHHRFTNGLLGANAYLVWNEADPEKPAFVLDLGVPPSYIRDYAAANGITVKYLIYSHGHYDHAYYAAQYKEQFPDALLLGHEAEAVILSDPVANVSELCGDAGCYPLPDKTLADGDTVVLGDGNNAAVWRVIHTPGHTPGGICLYCEATETMLTGDTLFSEGGFGRYDFKYGDVSILYKSLERLLSMDGNIRIFPGHGGMSAIGRERPTLRYVQALL